MTDNTFDQITYDDSLSQFVMKAVASMVIFYTVGRFLMMFV